MILERELKINSLLDRFGSGVFVTGATPLSQQPFSYRGKSYPDYAHLASSYYAEEKNAETCPERFGVNRSFIEANYWKAYLLPPVEDTYFTDLSLLQREASERGNRLIYVLLPIDFEDVESLDSELAENIRLRLKYLRQRLTSAGVEWLDLAETLPASAFADRYCACGHMGAAGREFVAAAARDFMNKR